MTGSQFPRAASGQTIVIDGDLWNRLMDQVERNGRLYACPPLMLADNGGGRVLTVMQSGTKLVRLQITAITGSACGKYTVRELAPPTADIATSGDAVPADIGAAGTTDCLGVDENELGRSTHSHLNAVDDLVDGTLLRVNSDGKRVYTFRQAPTATARFEVTLSSPSGSAGTSAAAPTYTYTVTALNGQVLGTAVSVGWSRPLGKVTAATKGVCYYTSAGALVLAQANEVPDEVACS